MSWSLVIGGVITAAIIVIIPVVLAGRSKGWSPRWSARARQELQLAMPHREAHARAPKALARLSLVGKPTVSDGLIEAKVGGNWKTYGNAIRIHLAPDGDRRTVAIISSRPTLPQFYDWGRSRSIVDAMANDLANGGAGL